MQGSKMGKVVTIYLSDDEARGLRDFCDENQCTQYSALKTAVKQLLHKPLNMHEDEPREILEYPQNDINDSIEEIKENEFDDIPKEELSLVDKIRGHRTVEEKHNSESLSALERLLKARNKRQAQPRNSHPN
jgi:hypothetical protein